MAEVVFCGETFRTAERIGLASMIEFALVAKSGVDANDMDGLAAMGHLLEECLADDAEFARLMATARKHKADGDMLMKVVADVVAVLSERPTSQPSDSSAGLPSTAPRSTGGSDFEVARRRLEERGRPDLAVAVLRAEQTRTA